MTTQPDDSRFAAVRRAGGAAYRAFLDAGYREHYADNGSHRTPYLLQKAVVRNGVREFFINVWVYDRSGYLPGDPVGFQPEAQFNSHAGQRPTFDVTLHADEMGPAEIEAFFVAVYERMGCEPYGD